MESAELFGLPINLLAAGAIVFFIFVVVNLWAYRQTRRNPTITHWEAVKQFDNSPFMRFVRIVGALAVVLVIVLFVTEMEDLSMDRGLRKQTQISLAFNAIERAKGAKGDVGQYAALEYLRSLEGKDKIALSGIDFSYRWFRDVNLSGERFNEVNFEGADLAGANLTQTALTRADFSGANLTRANLTRANLIGANLTGADLAGANLTGAFLPKVDFSGANLARANLTRADFSGVTMMFLPEGWTPPGVDPGGFISEADDLPPVFLPEGAAVRWHIAGADLTGVDLTGADLTSANLPRANLTGANLTGANLTGVDLTGADFSGADFSGVIFLPARVNLTGANLTGAENLSQEQLDSACAKPERPPKGIPDGLTWSSRPCLS